MYQRYLVLALLFTSMMVLPAPTSYATTTIQSTLVTDVTLIEAQLQMAISNEKGHGASALLEFERQLTVSEINTIESTGIEFARRGSSIINVGRIYSAVVYDEESLRQISEMGLIRATSGSKQFTPSIISSMDKIRANDVWNNLEIDGQPVDGSGVTVAVIDTGAAWLHPTFWRQYPAEFDFIFDSSEYYLDLDNDAVADPNEGPILTVSGQSGPFIDYTSDYMYISTDGVGDFDYADGDRWIGGIEGDGDDYIDLISDKGVILNISKVAILYDQYTSNIYIRGVNLTQAVSVGDFIEYDHHGTHVTSTIAGGQPGFTDYVGAAPGADLIIVRSQLNSADILDGISFAVENDADIINMSFSSYLGFLDGTDPEDLLVNEAFLNHGILTTAAAGNLGSHDKHASFTVPSNEDNTVLLRINNIQEDKSPYLSVLWQSDDRDEHIVLTPPSGDPIDLGEYSEIAGSSFALDTDNLSAYVFCEISPRGMNNIIVQVSADDHHWQNGIWDVTVTNTAGEDIWIDSYAWDGNWHTNYMTFESYTSNLRTISSPGTSDFAIAVASYSESANSITSTSSRGPRIDGAPKPNIAAPGVSITAAWGNFLSDDDLWENKEGTSMASPHVAGVLALIRQAEGNDNPWMDYSALINGAGGLTNHYEIPLNDWGHGLLDASASIMYVLNETIESGSTLSDWSVLETFTLDGDEPGVQADLDIRYVKVFQQADSLGFAINTDAVSDFTGTNMLSIEWDSDSNILTGENGVDLLLNITNGNLDIYEWNGSIYESSSLTGTWWQSATATFLRIDGLSHGVRGDLVFSTHNSTLSYVDSTSSASLSDRWLPIAESVRMTMSAENLTIIIDSFDGDSSLSTRSIGTSIVDGSLSILQSAIVTNAESSEMTVDLDLARSQYVNSLQFNITSDSKSIYLPLVMLSVTSSTLVRIIGGSLDNNIIRTGLLYSDRISGEFSIEGYDLVSQALVGFRHSTGLWFNFTINGNGLYEFVVVPSGFPSGQYDAYAIAKGTIISTIEMQFATFTIIEDNTLIVVGIGAAVVALIAIFAFRRFSIGRGAE
ncbi:MAG: S8 family serine peptidase [Candidatus Thorarchaeota archaeon]